MSDDHLHTITALCQRSREISLDKGWLNPDGSDPRSPEQVLLLFITEIAEVMEDLRNNLPINVIHFEGAKPCGIPTEIADIVIRLCQYAGSNQLVAKLQESFDLHYRRAMHAMSLEGVLARSVVKLARAYEDDMTKRVEALGEVIALLFKFSEQGQFPFELWNAIDRKEAYNRTRSVRHGGKAC